MPADRWAAPATELAAPGNPPGSAAAVLLDGTVELTAQAGVLRLGSPEPVRPDTVFALMSMTKVGPGNATWRDRLRTLAYRDRP